jgi:diacylglycerol O-acyltransferase
VTRQRLSPVDSALLRADAPANPMTVTGILIFGAAIDFETLRETLESRLLRFDRFRQRVIASRLPWGTLDAILDGDTGEPDPASALGEN